MTDPLRPPDDAPDGSQDRRDGGSNAPSTPSQTVDPTSPGAPLVSQNLVSSQDDDEVEALWAVLLDYIDEGTVVPVVGRDLLSVEMADAQGQPTSTLLYLLIARELARALKVTVEATAFDGPNPLGAVASEFILRGGNPNAIYSAMPGVLNRINLRRAPIMPDALRKLAEIEKFRVFVTTTFDPLLADCIAAVRRAAPTVVAYAPRAATALSEFRVGENRDRTLEILNGLPAAVVVHILGKLSNTPNYVVTEEDAFEFVYSLQETRPEGLFDLLSQMKLLILGCRFPSWLVRFFLRTSRRRRLLQSSLDRTDFVVDAAAAEDASLVQFLRNFKTQTEIFTKYQPTEFVDELHRRWTARARVGSDATTDFFTPCSVFISYASEDAQIAAQIAEQISAANLPVWLDRARLGSGDDWARKIRRNIDVAAAFVPILSRRCLVSGSREFRREWRHAYQVKSGLPQNADFIHPIGVDDVPRSSDAIDEELRALNWDALDPQGALPAAFIKKLRDAYRGAQLRSIRS